MPEPSPNSRDSSTGKTDSERISELLEQLHAANERFTQVRQHLERMLASTDYEHHRDRDAVEAEVRAANSDLEAISARIHKVLEKTAPSQTNSPGGKPDA